MAATIISNANFVQREIGVRIWWRLQQSCRFSRCVSGVVNKSKYFARGKAFVTPNYVSYALNIKQFSQTWVQPNFQVSKNALITFAEKINWSLSSEDLLINALTHNSYVKSDNEDQALGTSFKHNERLTYLGYETASSFVTEILYFKYPTLTAEQLWDLQNGLLQEDMLEKCGRDLGLHNLIFSKDEISSQIITDALLAIVGSMYMDQSPAMVREFIEKCVVPELTEDLIKEICQFEHPKFMLQQLNPGINFTAKILEKCSWQDVYGEEIDCYQVGIFNEDEVISQGQGDSQLKAEKSACQNLLKERYFAELKKSKFPYDYNEYVSEDEINLGLLPEGIRVVEIEKDENGFGFSLKGGEMRCEENKEYVKYHYYYPPFVSSVLEGSPAERCGLNAGDVILAVNDQKINRIGHYKVVKLLETLKGKAKFTVKFSRKVLISDEIETKFGQFKERKLLSQLSDPKWSKWHHSNSKKNRYEYDSVVRERQNFLPK